MVQQKERISRELTLIYHKEEDHHHDEIGEKPKVKIHAYDKDTDSRKKPNK